MAAGLWVGEIHLDCGLGKPGGTSGYKNPLKWFIPKAFPLLPYHLHGPKDLWAHFLSSIFSSASTAETGTRGLMSPWCSGTVLSWFSGFPLWSVSANSSQQVSPSAPLHSSSRPLVRVEVLVSSWKQLPGVTGMLTSARPVLRDSWWTLVHLNIPFSRLWTTTF